MTGLKLFLIGSCFQNRLKLCEIFLEIRSDYVIYSEKYAKIM